MLAASSADFDMNSLHHFGALLHLSQLMLVQILLVVVFMNALNLKAGKSFQCFLIIIGQFIRVDHAALVHHFLQSLLENFDGILASI